MTTISFGDFITTNEPVKSLTHGFRRQMGRNHHGKITTRHKGGGAKRLFREIDFTYNKLDVPYTIKTVEYDPNRTARLALLYYVDGSKAYVIAPEGLKVGDQVVSGERTKAKIGNRMQLQHIPVGFKIFNIEVQIGHGGQIVRSAGTSAVLVGIDGDHAILQLPSSEIRKVRKECMATIGTVSNPDHSLISYGKAGRRRWLGRKPEVLGKSMNAVDHPHGGGEGHSPIGLKAPKTPWGKKALGVKTRREKKSMHLIIRRRIKKKRK